MMRIGYSIKYYIILSILYLFMLLVAIFVNDWLIRVILIPLIVIGVASLVNERNNYFEVDDVKLTYRNRRYTREINWSDVVGIRAHTSSRWHLAAVAILSEDSFLIVSWWFAKYKELIKYVLEKCENNESVVIDDKVVKMVQHAAVDNT